MPTSWRTRSSSRSTIPTPARSIDPDNELTDTYCASFLSRSAMRALSCATSALCESSVTSEVVLGLDGDVGVAVSVASVGGPGSTRCAASGGLWLGNLGVRLGHRRRCLGRSPEDPAGRRRRPIGVWLPVLRGNPSRWRGWPSWGRIEHVPVHGLTSQSLGRIDFHEVEWTLEMRAPRCCRVACGRTFARSNV